MHDQIAEQIRAEMRVEIGKVTAEIVRLREENAKLRDEIDRLRPYTPAVDPMFSQDVRGPLFQPNTFP